MIRRFTAAGLIGLPLLHVTGCIQMPVPKPGQPNIVLILADDMGWGDVNANGNPNISTPVLNRLKSESLSFDRFYVCPLSAPTRAEMLTGRYFLRTGVSSVTSGYENMRTDEVTIAEVLKENGYTTGCFGKWHNGRYYPQHPNRQGFDEFVGFPVGHLGYYFDAFFLHNDEEKKSTGYTSDYFTDQALDFMDRNKERPFLCYVPFNVPHSPFQVPADYFNKYNSAGLDSTLSLLGELVKHNHELISGYKPVTTIEAGFPGERSFTLPVQDASLSGAIRYSSIHPNQSHTENWIQKGDSISWTLNIHEGGIYMEELQYGCPEDETGSEFILRSGSSEVSFIIDKPFDSQILPERDYVIRSESVERTWTWMTAGNLELTAGNERITLLLEDLKNREAGLIKSVRLTALNPVAVPPYPDSRMISGISIDWSTHQRHALGSDNFQLTWADDDHQYGIWGDGDGFAGTNGKYRVSMGVARIEGGAENYKGFDRYGHKESSEAEATIKGKSWGMICVRGVLYAWIHPDKPGGWGNWEYHHTESRLYMSNDKGASWQQAQWAFTNDDGLVGGNILQFGKDYAGARDKYVYHYMSDPEIVHDSTGNATELMVPGKIYLLRAPLKKIMERDAYEFFSGLIRGEPSWTMNVEEKQPVFVDNNGTGTPIGISFNPALKRYILSTQHSKPHSGMLGIFESPEPWGPWSTVTYVTNESWFGHDNAEIIPRNCFFWCFPVKWISADGRSATMVFTGGGRGKNNDSFNTVRVKFINP